MCSLYLDSALGVGDADEVGALPGAVGYPLGVGVVVGEVRDVQVTLESETLLSLGSPDFGSPKVF